MMTWTDTHHAISHLEGIKQVPRGYRQVSIVRHPYNKSAEVFALDGSFTPVFRECYSRTDAAESERVARAEGEEFATRMGWISA